MDLSIVIPARNEMFLKQTIDDILSHIEGETEIIAVLDGKWAEPRLVDHPRVRILYFPESIGQRAATNQGVRLSQAKYIMKCDAHCSFDQGFDVKMMKEMHDDWTCVPCMRNLWAFDWICPDGHRRYQGPSGPCKDCGKPTERDMKWIGKESPKSTSYCFDSLPHFQYFKEYSKRPEGKGDITETMSLQGSCFMLTREKYWELNICDEAFGSWGSQGIQVACSTWLSGGRVMCNKKTWYAHLFRTQGGNFGFPYEMSGRQQENAKKLARDMLYNNKFPKQILPSSWLVERFWPIPGWAQKDLDDLKLAGVKFMSQSVFVPSPKSITGLTESFSSVDVDGKGMSSETMSHPGFPSAGSNSSENVNSMANKSQMSGVATQPVITNMINDGNVLTKTHREGSDQPRIDNSVDTNFGTHISNSSISSNSNVSNPIPASSSTINSDFGKKTSDEFRSNKTSVKESHVVHDPHIIPQKGILFFTDNQLNLKIAHKVQNQLRTIGLPITSVSLKPMPHFGKNIHIPMKRGYEAYFTQILAGLEASDADIIFMCEHDVLYHKSHFDFTPSDKTKFYFNHNWWRYHTSDGFICRWDANQVSGLCAYRTTLLAWYKARMDEVKAGKKEWSFEPKGEGKTESWKSEFPNVDIRHTGTMTKDKRGIKDFRDKSTAKGFEMADEIPYWGKINI